MQADAIPMLLVHRQAVDIILVLLKEEHVLRYAPSFESLPKTALIDHDSIIAPHLQQILDVPQVFFSITLKLAVLVIKYIFGLNL